MPLRKKHTLRNKIIAVAILAVIIGLLVIYFQPTRYLTEVVLFP